MLQRGGVEDDLRPASLEQLLHEPFVADVPELDVVGVEQGTPLDGELETVQRRLVPVEHDHLGRVEAGDLPAQLGSDGPAGTRDQHPATGQVVGHAGDVGLDRLPAEEVGDLDVAHVLDLHVRRIAQVVHARQHLELERRLARAGVEAAYEPRRRARDRQDHGAYVVAAGHPLQLGGRAHHRDTVQPPVPLVGVVVEQRHRHPLRRRIAHHVTDQLGSAVARADDDHGFAVGASRTGQAQTGPVAEDAVGRATPEQQHEYAHRAGHRDRDPDVLRVEGDAERDQRDEAAEQGGENGVGEGTDGRAPLVQPQRRRQGQEDDPADEPGDKRRKQLRRRAVAHHDLQPRHRDVPEDPGAEIVEPLDERPDRSQVSEHGVQEDPRTVSMRLFTGLSAGK